MKNSNSNDRIRSLIHELDITQTEFCNKTGITKSALSNYLNGDRQPRQDQIDKISRAFNVSPTWLMGYDVPKEMYSPTMIVHRDSNPEDINEYGSLEIVTPVSRFQDYTDFIETADQCTHQQVRLAIDMLREYGHLNSLVDELRDASSMETKS